MLQTGTGGIPRDQLTGPYGADSTNGTGSVALAALAGSAGGSVRAIVPNVPIAPAEVKPVSDLCRT
jgi:hypothetical protein